MFKDYRGDFLYLKVDVAPLICAKFMEMKLSVLQ